MTGTGCSSARAWLAEQEVGRATHRESAAASAAHVARCESCGALLARYRGFSEACHADLEVALSAAAERRFLEAARAAPGWPSAERPRRRALILAAAAAVLVAAPLGLVVSEADVVEAPDSPPPPATAPAIAWRAGQVWVDGAQVDGATGRPLVAGAVVETSALGEASVRAPANAQLDLGPATSLRIADWRIESTRLELDTGTVRARVMHRPPGGVFEVVTATARVVVTGTEFSVTAAASGETFIEVRSGSVRVERAGDPGQREVLGVVTAGASLRVAPPPAAPIVEQDAEEPADTVEQAAVDLRASAQPRAATARPRRRSTAATLEVARQRLGEGDDAGAVDLLSELPAGEWRRDALLGDAYQLMGRYDAAAEAYGDALGRAGVASSVWVDLATLQERHLSAPDEAAATWRRYLGRDPAGRAAARAHLSLAKRAASAGDPGTAEEHLQHILTGRPGAPQVTEAVTRLGAMWLAQRRWAEAATLFDGHVDAAGRRGEVSLVGLIRVRTAQDRAAEARTLIARYRERFPAGRRAEEVRRLEAALAPP